jgi:hypothetical protein
MTQHDLSDIALDRALASLAQPDLSPLAARALLIASKRRLAGERSASSWVARGEPPVLIALAAMHMLWAIAQVFTRLR